MSSNNQFNNLKKAQTDEKVANAISPLNQNKVEEGLEGIKVMILDWPDEKRLKRLLSKMVKATIGGDVNETIPDEVGEELFEGGLQTGLESVCVSFEISGVSRSFTHQFVRTSKAKFHQQSMRYTYMGDKFNVRMPQSIAENPAAKEVFLNKVVDNNRAAYQELCEMGIPYQDARYACPIGIQTYIIGEYPLKVFLDTYAYRACPMFQWEISHVFKEMKKELVRVMPFMEPYIKLTCEKTHKCMFQGWESTEDACEYPWNKDRVFKSKIFTTGESK